VNRGQSGDTVLVFPAGLPEALSYAAQVREHGGRVIGASSVPNDPARRFYDEWFELPFVYEAAFDAALLDQIDGRQIGTIFSSHQVVLHHLKTLLKLRTPSPRLIGERARAADVGAARDGGASYQDYLRMATDLADSQEHAPVGPEEYSAVLDRIGQIRGESGMDKMGALMAVAASAPRGDVVEMGVLSGRSAFLLAWLARRHQLGPTLCIDPWGRADAMQWDSPEMLRLATQETDFDRFFAEFKANLIPSFHATVNYLRESSFDAATRYGKDFVVGPTEFGSTRYTGEIALLHVDGNHDETAAVRDLHDWTPRVVKGGWVIVDDYVWPFGDGPKVAADQLLDGWKGRISRSFALSGALFIQRA
jgi:hypothetical protein